MNVKIIFISALFAVLLVPVYANSHRLNMASHLDCPLSDKNHRQQCEVKLEFSTSPGILKEMMLIYRQQSQHNKVDVVVHIHQLEF